MPALSLNIKFNGRPLVVESLGIENTIADLKQELFHLTNVLPETQKILGLRRLNNLPVDDSVPLSEFIIKPSTKLMLIGSTQEDILNVNKTVEIVSTVVDDFDFKEEDVQICLLPENIEKVKRRSKSYRPRKLCTPRPGKHLLVLDVDYTIFDHLTPAESARQLARPYLYEFLSRAYADYDIAIWSATSMTWILAKLGQLGVIPPNASAILRQQNNETVESAQDSPITQSPPAAVPLPTSAQTREHPDPTEPPFRVCLLLDSSDMISVHFPTHGVKEVKPLAVIWDNHPQWGPHNTIMFDDVRRNFIMNPQNGLRIRSYRDAHVNHKTDRELRGLARYLELIAQHEPDFTQLNHNHWDRYIAKCKRAKHQAPSTNSPSNLLLQPAAGRLLQQDSVTTTGTSSSKNEGDDGAPDAHIESIRSSTIDAPGDAEANPDLS